MNKEALLRLADKLDGKGPYEKVGPIPNERFDIKQWVGASAKIVPLNKNIPLKDTLWVHSVVKTNLPCGTVACACGWAGADPWFRKRGFYTRAGGLYYKNAVGTTPTTIQSLETFFEVDSAESEYLFFWNPEDKNYKTPKQVATRIRKFVKAKEKEIERAKCASESI